MRIILCRRSRDENPYLKDQLEDLKHVGKMTVGRYKEHKYSNWKKVVQDRDRWKKVVEQARTVYRLQRFRRRRRRRRRRKSRNYSFLLQPAPRLRRCGFIPPQPLFMARCSTKH